MLSVTPISRAATTRTSPGALAALVLAITLATLAGCSTSIPGFKPIPVTANPSEEVTALAAEVGAARDQKLDVLSPSWFKRADRSLKKAVQQRDSGGAIGDILKDVAEGRAALERGRSFAAIASQQLPAVIQAREDARKAGAPALGESYQQVEERFLALTSAIENDDLGWARKNGGGVEKSFRKVELAAIKRNTLERIDDLIVKAETEGAEEHAPGVLLDTKQRRAALEQFIAGNRYAAAETSTRAADVLFYANRLVHLTQEAKTLVSKTPEQIALANEAVLHDLASAIELADARNQSAAGQQRALRTELTQLRHDHDALLTESAHQRTRIAELQGKSEGERERIARLEADRQFQSLFSEVSGFFDKDEAEVYKKDSRLVIRLRSLRFPVGGTVMSSENYPLMSKVQRAIGAFGDATVVIEGHTDSTGSTAVNDRISQERADAVRAYMVANGTIPSSRISAVGKGFSDPLASDRTAEGRAENRRIDVVIEAISPTQLMNSVSAPR